MRSNIDTLDSNSEPARPPAITLGIYSHVSPTLHDEAAQLVADLVLDG